MGALPDPILLGIGLHATADEHADARAALAVGHVEAEHGDHGHVAAGIQVQSPEIPVAAEGAVFTDLQVETPAVGRVDPVARVVLDEDAQRGIQSRSSLAFSWV